MTDNDNILDAKHLANITTTVRRLFRSTKVYNDIFVRIAAELHAAAKEGNRIAQVEFPMPVYGWELDIVCADLQARGFMCALESAQGMIRIVEYKSYSVGKGVTFWVSF